MTTSPAHFYNRPIPNTLNWAGKFRLSLGILICFSLFWLISTTLRVPPVPGMGGSLLAQPQPSVAIGAVGLALIVCTLIGKFVVGDLLIGAGHQPEGGLIAALIGLSGLVLRIGPVRYAFFAMPEPSAALLLAVELILLYIVVAFCWLLLQWAAPETPPHPADSAADRISAVVMHALVMAGCMMVFAASDAAGQGLAAVAISAALASMVASIAFQVNSSLWFLIGPALVALIGYGSVYLSPSGLAIGYPDGSLAALALATPLAYATAGPAGAIFGFWVALGWRHADNS